MIVESKVLPIKDQGSNVVDRTHKNKVNFLTIDNLMVGQEVMEGFCIKFSQFLCPEELLLFRRFTMHFNVDLVLCWSQKFPASLILLGKSNIVEVLVFSFRVVSRKLAGNSVLKIVHCLLIERKL